MVGPVVPGPVPAVRGAVSPAEPQRHHPAVGVRRHGHRRAPARRPPQHRVRGVVGRPGARQRRAVRHRRGSARSSRRATRPAPTTSGFGSRTSTSCRRPSTTPTTPRSVAGPLDIRRFAGEIDAAVFLASAWQDEQTGPSFADLLDRFDRAPVTRFTLYNGLHADGFAPQVLSEWKAFLDLYVAERRPQHPSADPQPRAGAHQRDLRRRRAAPARPLGWHRHRRRGPGEVRGRAAGAGPVRERRRSRPGSPGVDLRADQRRSGPTRPCRRPAGSSTRPARWRRSAPTDPAAVAIAPDPAVGPAHVLDRQQLGHLEGGPPVHLGPRRPRHGGRVRDRCRSPSR